MTEPRRIGVLTIGQAPRADDAVTELFAGLDEVRKDIGSGIEVIEIDDGDDGLLDARGKM